MCSRVDSRQAGRYRLIAVLLLCIALSLALQAASGAYQVELGGYTDEASQVVTGLVLRDYLLHGIPEHPIRFAEEYYVHYPKIVFGMWPPLYHVLIGLWTLPGSWREWILLLQGLLAGLLAFCSYLILRPRSGEIAGWVAAAATALCYPVLYTARIMMPDILLAILAVGAAALFGRFLKHGRTRDAIWFGVLAGLALTTKGNAISLVGVPPFAMILLRRWDLLRRPAFYGSAAVAGGMGLPWQILMAKLQSGTIPYSELTLGVVLENTRVYVTDVWRLAGPIFALAALAGLVLVFFRGSVRTDEITAVMVSLLGGFYVSHCIVTFGPEPRYYMQAIPSLVFLAMECVCSLPWRRTSAIAAGLLLLANAARSLPVERKESYGMKEAAAFLLAQPDVQGTATLISSTTVGEATLIGEVALQDRHRPSYWILRGTKSLSMAGWYGQEYSLLYKTPAEIHQYLEQVPVRFIILDDTPRLAPLPHHQLLRRMLTENPQSWRLLGIFPRQQATNVRGANIAVYAHVEARKPSHNPEIEMPFTLGRKIGGTTR